MAECELCGNRVFYDSPLCEKCKRTVFQILEIIKIYTEETQPPKWLVEAINELAWIYSRYPRVAAYLNTVEETTDRFVLDGKSELSIDEIKELDYTNLPRNKVLNLLEKSLIIVLEDGKCKPGELVKKLQKVRGEGYELNTIQVQEKLTEIYGVLTIALTKALIEEKRFIPQRALAVFHLLSLLMMASGEKISPLIDDVTINAACSNLTKRVKERFLRTLAGMGAINPGQPKIIGDITDRDNIPILKNNMLTYLEHMRERYRVREHQRERSAE